MPSDFDQQLYEEMIASMPNLEGHPDEGVYRTAFDHAAQRSARLAASRQPSAVSDEAVNDLISRVESLIKDWEFSDEHSDYSLGDVLGGNAWFLASAIVQTVDESAAMQTPVQVPEGER